MNVIQPKKLSALELPQKIPVWMLNALKVFVIMEVSVWQYIIDLSVSVLLDLLELDVKSTLMNVLQRLVIMEEPVLICPKDTGNLEWSFQQVAFLLLGLFSNALFFIGILGNSLFTWTSILITLFYEILSDSYKTLIGAFWVLFDLLLNFFGSI